MLSVLAVLSVLSVLSMLSALSVLSVLSRGVGEADSLSGGPVISQTQRIHGFRHVNVNR